MTEQEYGLLSAVAPTVAQSGDYPDFFMPWPELTGSAGRALGRAERAGNWWPRCRSATPGPAGSTPNSPLSHTPQSSRIKEIVTMTLALLDRPAPVHDDATRRQFLIGAASLALLLAGCASRDAETPRRFRLGRRPVPGPDRPQVRQH